MRSAIIKASKRVTGSFAAVIVDPKTKTHYGIKSGSSLYFGLGQLNQNPFSLVSSDLTAVLKFTKRLVDLKQGEFIEFDSESYNIYSFQAKKAKKGQPSIEAGTEIKREPVRSKLRAEDTELHPKYDFFMDQEINAEIETTGKLIKLFTGGSNTKRYMMEFLKKENLLDEISKLNTNIINQEFVNKQKKIFNSYIKSPKIDNFFDLVKMKYPQIYEELVKENFKNKYFFSGDKNLFIELIGNEFDKKKLLLAKALDSISENRDVANVNKNVNQFLKIIKDTFKNRGNIYTIACGSSFHAAKTGALYFNKIANLNIIPVLPGEFRGQYSQSLEKNDVIIGISQSGETKDLIDVFNYVENYNDKIKKVVLVNNLNSTLGQEKSDVAIPIFCGPEIAVPATKSFMNQIVLLYFLAIKVLELKTDNKKFINKKLELFKNIPLLLKETIATTKDQIDYVAHKIYMEPSMHILATGMTGIAKEGALKIRETVLNHAEGGEASEFKHGPNTILGKNTVFGIKNLKSMIKYYNKTIKDIEKTSKRQNLQHEEMQEIIKAVSSYLFTRTFPFNLSPNATGIFKEIVRNYDFFSPLYRNYPLIYITGPEEKDVNLTISQINTHKIRGGDSFIIAEENDELMQNVMESPDSEKYYGWGYITLPTTGNSLMTTFSSTVALQLLALNMSVRKMKYLNKLGAADHGVHPDVPKNVSKSITVD